jgi:hypothetical protein
VKLLQHRSKIDSHLPAQAVCLYADPIHVYRR